MNEFSGSWVRRRGVMVPVLDEPAKTLCRVCGAVSPVGLCRPCKDSQRVRVHGSHAGYAQHARRNELPCRACSDAEKAYQGARYRKGSLSPTDRLWCERAAIRGSWSLAERQARVSLTNVSI